MASVEIFLTVAVFDTTMPEHMLIVKLVIAQFVIHRLFILVNKATYILVSFITAFKNKKQRIKHQWICITLQLTLLLPYFLFVLLVTTLLDTATIPYLGFAFFIAGYPKPQRGWSTISPVSANPNDAVSDDNLY